MSHLIKAASGLVCLALAMQAHAINFDHVASYYPASADFSRVAGLSGTDKYGNVQTELHTGDAWAIDGPPEGTPVYTVSSDYYNAHFGALTFDYGSHALFNYLYNDDPVVLAAGGYYTLGGGDPVYVDTIPFVLQGLDAAAFTQSWGGGAFSSSTLTINGYNGDALVGSFTVNLSDTAFQWYDTPFADTPLTAVSFVSGGLGQRWLIDDLDIVYIKDLPAVANPLAAVPEPETWALMGLGMMGLVARRQQRKNRSGAQQ
ncbi:PEP-CTERM sorting domain-containing protein [Amantichitinum ursilacus]|uniref:PEP-CTERM motif protein n=1 Tax=Amantichitinum ursilacus TaxID=857265 RepID=A0A0N0GQT2_9NEIS|nr:PEP-CTERM sorting domain-containing protein [Amantichitinum ursilacus]KPC55180.1 PEP-CTERM motif protein [Amantichitinum ursilacus]